MDKFDIFKDRHFVLREPIYSEIWESEYLKSKNGIDNDYEIQYYYSEKIKPKTYYIYDYKTDTLYYVKHY